MKQKTEKLKNTDADGTKKLAKNEMKKERRNVLAVNKKLLSKICFIARLLTKMKLPKYF